jgi:hypothetical protein
MDDSILDAYVRAAERMLSPSAGMADRMAFLAMHNATNVAALGQRVRELRAENAALMETFYGGLDESDET